MVLSLDGPSNVVLDPGQTITQLITFTLAAGLPANTPLSAVIQADFGGPLPESLSIPVRVIIPGVTDAAIGRHRGSRRGKRRAGEPA